MGFKVGNPTSKSMTKSNFFSPSFNDFLLWKRDRYARVKGVSLLKLGLRKVDLVMLLDIGLPNVKPKKNFNAHQQEDILRISKLSLLLFLVPILKDLWQVETSRHFFWDTLYIAGEKGDKGNFGPPGKIGPRGQPGSSAMKGDKGHPGNSGKSGTGGLPGIDGQPGMKGDKGAPGNGRPGLPGFKGNQGATGTQGLPGLLGKKGSQGLSGGPGQQGIPGEKGAVGLQGQNGANGRPGQKGARESFQMIFCKM